MLSEMTYSANRSHRMMDTSWAETTLDDLEAAARTKDHVLGRHADIVEGDLTVTVGCIVVAEDREHALDLDAGEIVRDQDDGLLKVGVLVVRV